MDTSEPLRWLLGRGIALLVGTVVLLVVYRVGVTAIHRVVPAVIHAQATHLPSGSSSQDETGKRITTIEDLLLRLLRVGVLAGLVVMVLAVFGWWNLLKAIVLLIAAIMFATRDVVLDYVMGFLLLARGAVLPGRLRGRQRTPRGRGGRRGDRPASHASCATGWGRRMPSRTDSSACRPTGHGCSRSPSLTSLSPEPSTSIPPWRPAARVADEMRADPAWADTFLADAPTEISVTGIGLDGPSIRLQQRVPTGDPGSRGERASPTDDRGDGG